MGNDTERIEEEFPPGSIVDKTIDISGTGPQAISTA